MQNFGTNFPEKYSSLTLTLSIIPFSSYCMYEMPTGEFDVISRETHPPILSARERYCQF